MFVAVKLLLVLILVPAHAPVCKVAAVKSCTHSTSPEAPSACEAPPCCAKCEKDSNKPVPLAPQHDSPKKPPCPTDCLSPLCTVFSAVVTAALASTELDPPTIDRLSIAPYLLSPDGFYSLLDRPPRT